MMWRGNLGNGVKGRMGLLGTNGGWGWGTNEKGRERERENGNVWAKHIKRLRCKWKNE
jgi:hypothetical protein